MGICWYCSWGWPKPVADIYDKYEAIAGESAMRYGPAHCTWADENFERELVQSELDGFDEHVSKWNWEDRACTIARHSPEELAAVKQSLVELLSLPDDVLVPRPDYDDEHPADFPPPADFEMLHR